MAGLGDGTDRGEEKKSKEHTQSTGENGGILESEVVWAVSGEKKITWFSSH